MKRRHQVRGAPKLFGSSYQPPSQSRIRWPITRPLTTIIVIIAAFFLISRLPFFRVSTVEVSGSHNDSITQELKSLTGSSIFSRRIGLKVQETLQNHSEISTLQCRRGLPSSLRCELSYRKAEIIWRHQGQLFLIDDQGYIFQAVSTVLPELIVIDDLSTISPEVGKQILSRELISQYTTLITLMREAGLSYQSFVVQESLYHVSAKLQVDDKVLTAFLTVAAPLKSQVQTLKAVVEGKESVITERIDLRVPGYVYYK